MDPKVLLLPGGGAAGGRSVLRRVHIPGESGGAGRVGVGRGGAARGAAGRGPRLPDRAADLRVRGAGLAGGAGAGGSKVVPREVCDHEEKKSVVPACTTVS
jgi:hypothetical protein